MEEMNEIKAFSVFEAVEKFETNKYMKITCVQGEETKVVTSLEEARKFFEGVQQLNS